MSGRKFGINGFGRIGRTSWRVWWQRFRDQAELAVVNTSGSSEIETWAHLLKYDSNYGVWGEDLQVERWRTTKEVTPEQPELGVIKWADRAVVITAQRDPAQIPWGRYGVDTVIESTGIFTTRDKASAHLQGGAARVVLSAPAKGDDVPTIVRGVSGEANGSLTGWGPGGEPGGESRGEAAAGQPWTTTSVQPSTQTSAPPSAQIISNASCTTNCVAPVAAVMQQNFGVEKALMTTIHAYTDDQNLQDNSHQDLRRARSAAKNIVPTSTGAAKTVGAVMPEYQGIFDGLAIRVPVATGSLSDMVFVTQRATSVEEVNAAFTAAAASERWRGILAVTTDPIVSSDIIGRPESSIVDLGLTQVMGGNLVKVVSWYDNEWGYCNRLVEVVVW